MDSRSGRLTLFHFFCLWLLPTISIPAPVLAAPAAQTAAGDRSALTAEQSRAIMEAAWQEIHDKFYDPKFRGVDWDAVHAQYVQRATEVHDREQAVALVREMIGLLHNSHSGVMTHAELDWMKNELPFFFERVNGRTFVSYVLETRGDGANGPGTGVRFGDEIVTVDGRPAAQLKRIAVSWLTPVLSDPYYGAPGSTAKLGLRRNGHALTVKVKRVQQDSVEPLFAEQYGPVGYLRLLTLTAATVPPETLRQAMDKVDGSDGLILDLRGCVGGDAPDADGLGGMLLGAGVKLVTLVSLAMWAHFLRHVDDEGTRADVLAQRTGLGRLGEQIAAETDAAWPEYLPILGYGLFSKATAKKRKVDGDDGAERTLTALLTRPLLAFAMEFESGFPLSLAVCADLLRLVEEEGVATRELPRMSGVSSEALAMAMGLLKKRGAVETATEKRRGKIVWLTELGRADQAAYRERVKRIEAQWKERWQTDELGGVLERLGDADETGRSRLMAALETRAGWRAEKRAAETLPHFPMVLHRGGYPDGS